MWKIRILAVCTVFFCLGSASGPPRAQGTDRINPGGGITAPISEQGATGTLARAVRHELKSGGLSATITVLTTGTPFPAGGSAFAQIKITNMENARPADAELVFETQTAKLHGASGSQLIMREEGAVRIASVKKISARKPRSIVVEVKLRAPPADTPVNARANRLKITLRAPGTAGVTTTLSWDVTSCASGFYSEIVKVREGSGSGIAAALKAARSRDRTRPGRWLFPPRFKSASAARTCVRRARRWSSARKRYISRCTKYQTNEPAIASASATTKSERKIFGFASRYVSARAVDRELAQTRDSGWATNRVSQNLRGFLKQDANPAICTGAIGFLDYFDARMAGFSKRADTFAQMARTSRERAVIRTREALDIVKSDPGGHPGFGAAPLDIGNEPAAATLKSQIASLARLANDTALGARVDDADTSFEALRAMSSFLGSAAAKPLAPATRSAMYRALSAIEAAEYIGAVALHYADLRHSIIGSMAAIRSAHATNCTCGG